MDSMISWSPNLKMSDYEQFAIQNALAYTKGNLREVSYMLEIPLDELGLKISNIETDTKQELSEVDYWKRHRRLVERFTNGNISKEEFDQQVRVLHGHHALPVDDQVEDAGIELESKIDETISEQKVQVQSAPKLQQYAHSMKTQKR